MSQFGQITHTHQYVVPFHTKKLFTTLRVNSPSFSGRIVPLFDTMLVHQGKGSRTPTEPHYTPSPKADTSHPTTSSILLPSIPTAPIPPVTQNCYNSNQQYLRRARIAQLKERVQVLEDIEGVAAKQSRDDDPIKGRSINEGEVAAERISNDSEDIARVLTSREMSEVGPLSGKDPLVIAVADTECFPRFPSGYRVIEARRGDQSFGVNLHQMSRVCNIWQLSRIHCVHAMVGYMHIKMNLELGVDEWYSQCKWYEAYQFSINPVYGPKFWKPTSQPPPLPHVERNMHERPRKGESDI
nr:zinc finger, PMZ-type [Tanacetum cinerariifolium]